MTVKSTVTPIKNVINSDRFEPRYHFIYNKFHEYEENANTKLIKLGDKNLLKNITDGEHAGQIFVEEGIRFIKNSAVRDFNINLLDGFYITEEKHTQQGRSALKKHDVLFTTIGHLGSSAIVPEDFGEANINQNVVKMEINSEFLDPYYLTAYLNSIITKKQISALFTGNIHSIITYPKIKNIRIIIPDKQFSDKIRDKYKKAIENDTQSFNLIQKAQDLFYKRCGIDFSKIIKRKIFSTNISDIRDADLWTTKYSYPLYVDVLKALEKKWQTVSLGTIATIKKGKEVGSANYNKYLDKKESDVPFIRTSDLINYELDLFPDFYIPKEIYEELNQEIEANEIFFTKDGKIGMTAMATENDKIINASGISRIVIKAEGEKNNLSPEYIFLILSLKETGLYPALRRTVTASTIPHLREERLKEIEIPILDKNSIDKITSLITSAFELKNEKKQLIKEIRKEMDEFGTNEISI